MTEPFDYRDPQGLEFELDLPSAPPVRGQAKAHAPASPARPLAEFSEFAEPELPELPEEFMALPDELSAPFAEPPPAFAESEAWSLELEDIAPPVATPSLASAPRPVTPVRAATLVRAATPLSLPQPGVAQRSADAPPVRTLELRLAEAVDRLSPPVRGGLLALTIVGMLLLATSVLMAGVRGALHTVEVMRAEAEAARTGGLPGVTPGAAPDHDPYESYRVDDLVDVDDEGRHLPQR